MALFIANMSGTTKILAPQLQVKIGILLSTVFGVLVWCPMCWLVFALIFLSLQRFIDK
jgi:hypothetical protein